MNFIQDKNTIMKTKDNKIFYCIEKEEYNENTLNNYINIDQNIKVLCLIKSNRTHQYKTEEIIKKILIVSLSHSLEFSRELSDKYQADYKNMINILNNTENNNILITSLKNFIINNLDINNDVLCNPNLGFEFYNSNISADCDIIIGNNLIDIKCTKEKSNKDISEIFQLLGYTSLYLFNPKYNKKISNVSIIIYN